MFPPVAGTAAPLRELADFHDRLSPMLVKELRQGLRAKTFISVFLALQGFLAFILLIAAASASTSNDDGGGSISKVIFFFFSIAALIVQPLRGIGALHTEIKGNTIELMVMTRLNSWRIVLGKWVSLVSQTGLLFVAVVPYLILRYFFGGMQLFSELLALGMVLFLSGVLTAVTVGLSAVPSILIRGLLPLAGSAFVLRGIIEATSGDRFGYVVHTFGLQSSEDRWRFFGIVVWGAYFAWLLLGLATSLIAPAAENHSTLRRLVTLGTLLLAGVVTALTHLSAKGIVLTLTVAVAPPVILALSESFYLLPPVCTPFLKKGQVGKLAGRFLYPGWPAGTLFSLGAVLLAGGIYLFAGKSAYHPEATILLLTTAGTLFFPATVIGLMHKRVKNRFPAYLAVMLISIIVPLVAFTISASMPSREFLWAFCWLPPMNAYMQGIGGITDQTLIQVSGGFAAFYAVAALIIALTQFGKISKAEQEAGQAKLPS
jgi:hypothetical protein